MTAESISIYTIDFPDPTVIDYKNDHFSTLQANESFQYPITSNIQTLTAKKVERGNDPYGLLFVPNLTSDACKDKEKDYLPSNVTRLANLPSTDTQYALVAFAPWFNATCMLQYFDAARRTHLKAFIVYQPGTSNSMPPVLNDPSWLLNDGGSWMTANQFPTYAVSSSAGSIVAEQLGQYSGNISDVPYGEDILLSDSQFHVTDYVRLWVTVSTDPGSQLPSLWVFLLIVLGLLILAFSGTSLAMHFVQRRRRESLRRRVVSGEVDLEAFGVKRLTVPRDYMDKLPMYTYSAPPASGPAETENMPSPAIEAGPQIVRVSSAPTLPAPAMQNSGTFSQATCSICLDDFEPNESQIRELPCQHIYHADCIDSFLISNSSLCPLCKQSVLPVGYCPKITNIMVRRERLLRRTRTRQQALEQPPPGHGSAPETSSRPARAFGSLGSRVGGAFAGRRIFSAPERTRPQPDIELAAPTTTPEITPAPVQTSNSTTQCPPPASQNRGEWARERATAVLSNRQAPGSIQDEENAPRWRRGLRKIFPGFR